MGSRQPIMLIVRRLECTKSLNHCGFRFYRAALLEGQYPQFAERLEQLPGAQQERRVRGPAETFVPGHEGFIDEDPTLQKGAGKDRKQGPVEVIRDHDAAE